MRAGAPRARWALSFADLCLLLLGFLVLLQARPEPGRLGASLRQAFNADAGPQLDVPANSLFLRGEAVLRPAGLATLTRFAKAGGDGHIVVQSRGTEPRSARFEGWELAAARAAAVARALARAGVAEGRISIDVAPGTGGGQRLILIRS